jgi:hypothetical protein
MTQPMASHSLAAKDWPSRTSPTRAATAGSRLIQMPKTRGGIRRSASISSEYGMIEESSPMPRPASRMPGRSSAPRPAAMPTGVITTAETSMAMASPAEPGKRWPVARLSRM